MKLDISYLTASKYTHIDHIQVINRLINEGEERKEVLRQFGMTLKWNRDADGWYDDANCHYHANII